MGSSKSNSLILWADQKIISFLTRLVLAGQRSISKVRGEGEEAGEGGQNLETAFKFMKGLVGTLSDPSSNYPRSLQKSTPLPMGYPWVPGGPV